MSEPQLEAMEPWFEPLAQAIGRAVIGGSALEKVLLLDLVRRRAEGEGMGAELESWIERAERQPAGALLKRLRRAGMDEQLAETVDKAIAERNWLVHRFMEDPQVVAVMSSGGSGVDELITRVDGIAATLQEAVNAIGGSVFAGLEQLLGLSMPELMAAAAQIDPDTIDDEQMRTFMRAVPTLDPEEMRELFEGRAPD